MVANQSVLVQVADLEGNLTTVGLLTVYRNSSTGVLSVPLDLVDGAQYDMLWMPSSDLSQTALTLVIRQLA